ncbi:MAG: hypothetical protein KDA88_21220 [Planctomycetaceae bacterium]|nr:hypothetical protein [Planctomycetaceae bacterium]
MTHAAEPQERSPMMHLARAMVFAAVIGTILMAQSAPTISTGGLDAPQSVAEPGAALPQLETDIPVPPPSKSPEDMFPTFESSLVPPLPQLPIEPTRATVSAGAEDVNAVGEENIVLPPAVDLPEVIAEEEQLAVQFAVPAPSEPASSVVEQTFDDGWVVQITPGPSRKQPELVVNGRKYSEVYASIPYRRSEYLANPSYRHDSTMEILMGQMRPTTIIRHDTPVRINNDVKPTPRPYRSTPSDYFAYPQQYGLFPGPLPVMNPFLPGVMSPLTF